MDSTHAVGMLLVGISAFLLAAQWQQWRATGAEQLASSRWQLHMRRLMWRRAVASSLVGVVGATLMAFETVPQTPLSITAYLLALVLMTCWILWLACLDMLANRRFHAEQNLDRIASELRRDHADADRVDSTNAD
ncbi:MAG: hypothetical protein AAGD11_16225 [Planctomycetota bacterium]